MNEDDIIRVGLDFGTHQTKICINRITDECHGESIYEFFKFTDNDGEEQYVLPSVVQINVDKTLSYGYVDENKKGNSLFQSNDPFEIHFDDCSIETQSRFLYDKYSTENNSPDDINLLKEMFEKRRNKLLQLYDDDCLFRYFKQATFAERPWGKAIEPVLLSIWYLTYIIFLLEQRFGTDFSLNMGIPTGYKDYEQKKCLAVRILLSAYNLVEGVFQFDMDAFLSASFDELVVKTQLIDFSERDKDDYGINIFPEAYASLISLTTSGKLTPGMSLSADIGGGTTDISFFTLKDGKPIIYRYWSVNRGLNYIAENSGFNYTCDAFANRVDKTIVEKYNSKKLEIISILIKDLANNISKTSVPVSSLYEALNNRVLVYSGGGSIYPFIAEAIKPYFTDIKYIKPSIWDVEHVIDKEKVSKLCQVLTTSYGLSIGNGKDDDGDEVELHDFQELFDTLPKKEMKEDKMI